MYCADRTRPADLIRVDTTTGAATTLLRIQTELHDLTLSPSGRYLFIAHDRIDDPDTGLGRITVLDTHSRKVVDRIDIDAVPGLAALSPDGQRLYAASTPDSAEPAPGRFTSIDIGRYR
ncbi:YncE family protein [Nocardia carnea]|uniref:YncE family protein n=1 Tax=Nocardia carnea TaxID=37328 RepID=UPI002456958C|nr:hypothetical protein [Nocardia carnea]